MLERAETRLKLLDLVEMLFWVEWFKKRRHPWVSTP